MAIQKVLKTFIICSKGNKNKLLEDLQLWGKMELIGINEPADDETDTLCSSMISKLKFMVKLSEDFGIKISAWQRLKAGIPEINKEKIAELSRKINVEEEYKELRKIDKKIKKARGDVEEFKAQQEDLKVLKEIDLANRDLLSNMTEISIGNIDQEDLIRLFENTDIYTETITDSKTPKIAVIYMKKNSNKIVPFLDECGFQKMSLPEEKTPAQKIEEIECRIEATIKEIEDNISNIKKDFLSSAREYGILLDYYENKNRLETEAGRTHKTKYMSVISGWIPDILKDEITKVLNKSNPNCFIEFYEPDKEDNPPVILKNSPFSESFEVVTDLYGTPSYGWIDPTPYVAPFFAFFFGLCLTDAGYGLILCVLCAWAIKKLKISGGLKKFVYLLLWGGIASVIAGALTGGWFGNVFTNVKFFNNLKIIDPLEKPQYFMYFAVLLGYIQVIFGVILSMLQKFKTNDTKSAVFEEMPWLVILLSLPVCFVGKISHIGIKFAITGVAGVVFLSGYRSSNIFARVGAGLYKLYGGTDYFKDMISYSRLFALGMGTAILGMAVNEISLLLVGIKPLGIPIGYLLMAIVFIAGHIFNMAMSMLSAYIHTSRLQYVEFFKWFFKGGGRSFMPFSWKSRRVNLVQ